jgi:hypothetical protein
MPLFTYWGTGRVTHSGFSCSGENRSWRSAEQLLVLKCAVSTGLGFHHYAHPALKRWAILFRPASGTCVIVMQSFGVRAGLSAGVNLGVTNLPSPKGVTIVAQPAAAGWVSI